MLEPILSSFSAFGPQMIREGFAVADASAGCAVHVNVDSPQRDHHSTLPYRASPRRKEAGTQPGVCWTCSSWRCGGGLGVGVVPSQRRAHPQQCSSALGRNLRNGAWRCEALRGNAWNAGISACARGHCLRSCLELCLEERGLLRSGRAWC
jgi:hypothetical protein